MKNHFDRLKSLMTTGFGRILNKGTPVKVDEVDVVVDEGSLDIDVIPPPFDENDTADVDDKAVDNSLTFEFNVPMHQ